MENAVMSKNILVTGGSAGIGRAVAERLAEEGYGVVNIDRQAPKALVAGETFVEADLGRPDAVRDLFEELARKHDFVGLVNNVGVARPGTLEAATLEDLDVVVRLNLGISLIAAQAVIGGMKRRRFGRIVNMSSRSGLGKELRSVYSATKAGLNGFTRTWALELAQHGITVNSVAPGPIETDLFRDANPADSPKTKAIIDRIPVKRMGQPADVAHAVAFFLDPRSGFTTGQVLYVCGGMTIGAA
jgi:NAD(P)-dependent dehydrogenase (short-subunit alcohol dehydrogenase family)